LVNLTTFFFGPPPIGINPPRRTPTGGGAEELPAQESTAFAEPVDSYVPGGQTSAIAADVISDFYREVLDHPEQYSHLRRGLTDPVTGVALDNPFEITPDMKQHVANLRSRFPEETQTERGTALLLLRSLVDTSTYPIAITSEGRMEFVTDLPPEEGGLRVRFNSDRQHPARIQNGALLPQQILETPAGERIGYCLEQSQLLVCLLRGAGIDAHIYEEPGHAYVLATLDGETYQLDPAMFAFERNAQHSSTDREATAIYYRSEAFASSRQGRNEEALRRIETSLLLNPEDVRSWNARGHFLSALGRYEEALASFERSVTINPLNLPALGNIAYTLGDMGRIEESQAAWQAVLEIVPDNEEAQEALASLTVEQDPSGE